MTAPTQTGGRPVGALRQDEAEREIEAFLSKMEEGSAETQEAVKQPQQDAEPVEQTEGEPEKAEGDTEKEATADEETKQEGTEGEKQEGTEQDDPWISPRKIKVDGEDVEVTPEEALKSYSREGHWTRRMQKQSEREKEFAAEADAVRQEREKYAALLGQLDSEVMAHVPQDTDWVKLRQENPDEFAVRWSEHQFQLAQKARVRTELEATQQRILEDREKQFQAHLIVEQEKLFTVIPELKDETKRASYRAAIMDYGRDQGFSDDDLEGVSDHKALVILDKARKWDEHSRKQVTQRAEIQKKISKASVTAKPGVQGESQSRVVTDLTRSKQRLAKTGKREDAVRTLELAMEAAEQK